MYQNTTQYIVEALGITPAEQKKMKTLISAEESYRRLTQKRRSAGIKPRAEYEETAQQRLKEALKLSDEGFKAGLIAERLGVNVRTIQRYLKYDKSVPYMY